jgi:hypothetical protein
MVAQLVFFWVYALVALHDSSISFLLGVIHQNVGAHCQVLPHQFCIVRLQVYPTKQKMKRKTTHMSTYILEDIKIGSVQDKPLMSYSLI